MVRLSDSLKPDSGPRTTGREEKPPVESFLEVVILTTDHALVDLVRRAIEDRGYRIRHFLSVAELRERLKAAGRVIVVMDARAEGTAEFHRELSTLGYSNQLIIAPDETTAVSFRGLKGVTVLTQPVSSEDLLNTIQEIATRPEEPTAKAGLFSTLTRPAEAARPAEPSLQEEETGEFALDAQLSIEPGGDPVRLSDLVPPSEPPAEKEEAPAKEKEPPAAVEEPLREEAAVEAVKEPTEGEMPEPAAFPEAPPLIQPHTLEVPEPVEAPTGTEARADDSAEKEIYENSVEFIYRFLCGHRSRSNPPLNEVAGAVEKVVSELEQSAALCLQIVQHVPEFGDADRYLAYHHVNVMLLVVRAGMGKKLQAKELYELTLTAAVHDVGMTQLPEGLITRQGKLDQSGYSQIRQHPAYGKQQLKAYSGAYPWLPEVVYQEHERHDGSGYPEGLTGNEIHLYAQIIGLVDTYEALTHLRPFRDQMIPFNVLQQLIRLGGQLFPSDLVKAFIEEISVFPVGSFVRLNSGEICEVTKVNRGYPLRPIVVVIFASDGSPLQQGREIDLKAEPMLYITGPEDVRGLKRG